MARHYAGNLVRKGVYMSVWPPDVCFVSADNEPLTGNPDASYRRLPGVLVVAISPLLGALFVIGFPFVIVAAIGYALVHPLLTRLSARARDRAYLMRGDYALATAHLDGKTKKHGDGAGETTATDDGALDDLRAEVEAEREQKRRSE